MMKKILLPTMLILLLALLAACSGSTQATPGTAAEELTIEQLALGSLKLEDTDQGITEAQANELLPLWQAYSALAAGDTAATAELQGLAAQIAEAMTPAQTEAISAMQIDDAAVQAFLQEQGARFGARSQTGDGSGSSRTGLGQRGGGAGPVPGGPPGGPPAGQNIGQLNPEARATAVAERLGNDPDALKAFQQRALVGGVIRLLQSKTGQLPTPEPLTLTPPLVERLAQAAGVDAAALQTSLDGGLSLSEAISQNEGDLAAATEVIRGIYANRYGLTGDALEQQLTTFMQAVP